jgi:hypothetical protein
VRRAETQMQIAAADARAAQSGPLAEAEALQEVTRKQTELAELAAVRTQKELIASTIRPAEAEAEALVRRAEGEREARIAQAQADAERVRLAGQAEATVTVTKGEAQARVVAVNAEAEAQRTTLEGNAEAGIVFTKGEAEAKALELRAQAYRQFNEAAVIQTVLSMLPEIVRAAAEPMGNIGSLTVLSSDGASEVVRTTTRTVAEAGAAVKGLTGIDIPALLGSAMGVAGTAPEAPGGGRGRGGGPGGAGGRGGGSRPGAGGAGGSSRSGAATSTPTAGGRPGVQARPAPVVSAPAEADEDPAVAMARADESIRRAAAAGRATTEAAMAAAAGMPVPGTAVVSAPAPARPPSASTGPGADRAVGEPRPAPGIGGRPASEAPGAEAVRAALVRQLAGAMRSIPGVERFGRLRLAELDRAGSTTLKSLWRNARTDLEDSYGQLTIADVLERFAGPGSGGAA